MLIKPTRRGLITGGAALAAYAALPRDVEAQSPYPIAPGASSGGGGGGATFVGYTIKESTNATSFNIPLSGANYVGLAPANGDWCAVSTVSSLGGIAATMHTSGQAFTSTHTGSDASAGDWFLAGQVQAGDVASPSIDAANITTTEPFMVCIYRGLTTLAFQAWEAGTGTTLAFSSFTPPGGCKLVGLQAVEYGGTAGSVPALSSGSYTNRIAAINAPLGAGYFVNVAWDQLASPTGAAQTISALTGGIQFAHQFVGS